MFRGSDVKEIQQSLNKLGNKLKEDGVFGKLTDSAIRKLQKSAKIRIDGIVGSKTRDALKKALAGLSVPKTDINIKDLQNKLNIIGYNCGTVDGYIGSRTTNAIKKFQKQVGLIVDGFAGEYTLKVLNEIFDRFKAWGFTSPSQFWVKQFQAAMSLKPDGLVGKGTLSKINGKVIVPRFTEEDMRCQCNGYCNGYPVGQKSLCVRILIERMMREVEKTYPDAKFYITNRKTKAPDGAIAGGYRCVKWNKARGGASGSQHLKGVAVDIGCSDSKIRALLEKFALSLNKFGGVGYGARYIVHVDLRGKKSRWKY